MPSLQIPYETILEIRRDFIRPLTFRQIFCIYTGRDEATTPPLRIQMRYSSVLDIRFIWEE